MPTRCYKQSCIISGPTLSQYTIFCNFHFVMLSFLNFYYVRISKSSDNFILLPRELLVNFPLYLILILNIAFSEMRPCPVRFFLTYQCFFSSTLLSSFCINLILICSFLTPFSSQMCFSLFYICSNSNQPLF